MPRVKGGNVARKRRKRILKLAKGYFGSKHLLYRTANEQVMNSLAYAYRDRKQRKRNFRKLWITRINAAARLNGLSYSRFINGLKQAGVDINRKMLADIAVHDEAGFTEICEVAKKGLAGEVVTPEPKPVKQKAEPKKAEPKEEPKEEPKAEPKAEPKEEPKEEPKAEPKAEPKEEPKEAAQEDVNEETTESYTQEELENMTVKELKDLARNRDLSGYSTMRKAELVDLLK